MDNNLKNRFEYLNDLSLSELKNLREEINQELSSYLELLESKGSSYKKSEIENSDFGYARDKATYIDYLIQEKTNHKSR